MFFTDAVRSKLVSRIRPWLEEEPEIELKLGLLSSRFVLRNLTFDPSAISRLIKNSTDLEFKRFTIRELSFRISPWSVPSLIAEARGADVTLTPRESVDRRRVVPGDSEVKRRKEVIASLDPEGASLHDIIERTSITAASENGFMTVLANAMLSCCQIQIEDIYIKLLFLNDSHACLLKVDEFSLEPQLLHGISLSKGFFGSLFRSRKVSFLDINFNRVDFGLKENDCINWMASMTALSACLRFSNLLLLDYNIQIPHVNFQLSPTVIPVLSVLLNVLSSKRIKVERDGQELWKIAARRVGYLTLTPKLSLYRIIDMVLLWSRYVCAYESLLLMVGYSANKNSRNNIAKVFSDNKLLIRVKQQWKLVSELEKKLPAEALASARRIARHRALSFSLSSNLEVTAGSIHTSLWKISALVLYLWRILCFIFQSLTQFSTIPMLGGASNDLASHFQFSISLGELCITLSQANTEHAPIDGKVDSDANSPYLTYASLCFVASYISIVFSTDIAINNLLLAFGELKMHLTSLTKVSTLKVDSRDKRDLSSKDLKLGTSDESKIIMWGDPVLLYNPSENDAFNSSDPVFDRTPIFTLKDSIVNLWSNWEKVSKSCEEMNVKHKEQPLLLFELKNYIMDPCIERGDYGLWECSLALGKLNFDLDYSSILSITLLIKQLLFYCQWTNRVGRTYTLSNSASVMVEEFQTKRTDNVGLSTTRVKAAILDIFPDKNIQIGAFITGPGIRLSLQNELLVARSQDFSRNSAQGKTGYCFSVDLAAIELSVWPAYKGALAQIMGKLGFNEHVPEYLSTTEPQEVDIPKPHANECFLSQGRIPLDACMRFNGLAVMIDESEVNLQSQIVKPMSFVLRLSTRRYYLHSLTTTVNILSMVLTGISTGAAVLFYMDELWAFLQIFEAMFSLALPACNSFDSVSAGYSQDFIRKLMTTAMEVTERNIVESEHTNGTKIMTTTQIVLDATLQFEPMDVIFNGFRGNHIAGASVKSEGASSSATPYFGNSPAHKKSSIIEPLDLPSFAIGVFIRKSCINIAWQGTHLGLLSNFSGLKSVIFNHENLLGVHTDIYKIKCMLEQSSEQLYLFIISNCSFSFHLEPHGVALRSTNAGDAQNVCISTGSQDSSANANDSKPRSYVPDHDLKSSHLLTTTTPLEASACCALVDMQVDEIFVSSYGVKDELTGKHQPNKLEILVLICKATHTVSCEIQGGNVFLETSSLAAFVHCFQAYYLLLSNSPLLVLQTSRGPSCFVGFSTVSDESAAKPANMSSEEFVAGALSTAPLSEAENVFRWNILKDFTLEQSRFSLTLAGKDVSGCVQELVVEADTSLRLLCSERKVLFDLKRLSIMTRNLHKCMPDQSKELLMPQLGSSRLVTLSTTQRSRNYNSSQVTENLPSGRDEQSLHPQAFPKEKFPDDDASSSTYDGNYILKHLVASVMIKKVIRVSELGYVPLKSDWSGNGFISGIDLTITLSEIQILSELFEPLSGILNRKSSPNLKQHNGSRTQGPTNEADWSIPDGAIVVIKDLSEHMYFAIEGEGVGCKYHLGGTLHYTLVGERALFRVKYHKGWMSKVYCISLISLYAKNDRGEALRLNYSPGSGFVEVSSSKDKGGSLWQTFPYKHSSYEEDEDAKFYNTSSRKVFHLVNQKCKCAIAFVNGVPEFVKKPGNPFKVKVVNDFALTRNGRLSVPSEQSNVNCITNSQESSFQVGEVSVFGSNPSYVIINIDKIALTIFHEVSDANDKVPLIRGNVSDIDVIGQMLVSKCRIISSFNISVQYMELRRNVWRDIISPVGSSLFFHSRFPHQDFSEVNSKMPAHVYFKMRQVDLSLSGISLDVLLYVAGYLNIAGPYAVRRSVIFPNCCKVENYSGLSLLCHFPDNHDVMVTRKQSASIFLRNVSTGDQLTGSESLISVRLTEHGFFSTSPIDVSVSNDCFFAWRSRAISLKDSRSFPGPVIVVEVRHRAEDGLSLVVSPLLRISNESEFPMELRFHRPQATENESATILLKSGDTIDDSIALFSALELSGGAKRALMSLTLGNFLLSVRPEITDKTSKNKEAVSVKWSEELQGGKAIRVSGILDTLSYKFRKTFGVESAKFFFISLRCPLFIEDQHVSDVYFLVQTASRDVPVMQPPNVGGASDSKTSPVALQVQKEIFIYPTVQVYNLLQSEIRVLLTENDPELCINGELNDFGKNASIPSGSNAYLYANPEMIYFTVTLTTYSSKCKPVSSVEWLKRLNKQKNEVHYMDTELDFGGKYFAVLRLSRADKGILEATIFTSYTLQNDTELSLFCWSSNRKPLSQEEFKKYGPKIPPDVGCFLPPRSIESWFLKSNKVHLKWLEGKTSAVLLDLDMLSGFTELSLEAQDNFGLKHLMKLGVSLRPCPYKVSVPSQVICILPRYIIANESKEPIMVRQCYLQDDTDGTTTIEGNQKVALKIKNKSSKMQETSILESILRRHRNLNEDSQVFIQFLLRETGLSWSGPICVSSLGRFFLKFKRPSSSLDGQSKLASWPEKKPTQFAVIQTVEENSSLVLHFHRPVNVALPYRIENFLCGSSIMYWQKDTVESDALISGDSVEYVWDDLNLPHKLVVQISDLHLSREINIDKICTWKSFFKIRQHQGLLLHLPSDKGLRVEKRTDGSRGLEVFKVGFEVYADGLTRVLRICERADSYEGEKLIQPSLNIQFRVSYFAIHLLEKSRQDIESMELAIYSTILVGRLTDVALDLLLTDRYRYYSLRVQSFTVDEKWQGAPFASMIRRNQIHDVGSDDNILQITFILQSTSSSVKQVKYSSILLQPIDLKVDEETLMKLVPFWRTSLSDSRTQSRQFYFKHFEIHPIKIFASFLPANPNSSYSSSQEALRSLLHSVIKVPAVNNKVVELNGILLTHALVTSRELLIKCLQHYSWYVMRAVYIAKGSPLLPPAFASIFDDTASSSLDVFFDPSDGSVSLPGLTLGMFKFISKCIDSKGFSGTKRYFGDLGKTVKLAGSNVLFAVVTEISDSIVRGAETGGLNGMVTGFHHGILRLAMEPSLLGAAVLEGGPDRKIKLDHSPGVDELYIEGYLQAMLDVTYKQEYLRVRVIDNQVILKNLPPNSSVINEILENVKSFLVSKALLKGDALTASRPLRHLRTESEWRIGPTVLTLCEHLFVSFAIRMLRKQASKIPLRNIWERNAETGDSGEASPGGSQEKPSMIWAIGKFVFKGMVAYLDGRLCRNIPNPIARRIVSGFLLSYLDQKRS